MVFGGGGGSANAQGSSPSGNNPFDKDKKDKTGKDSGKDSKKTQYMGFDGGIMDDMSLDDTAVAQVVATRATRNLSRTMLQGKVIEAVMENGINSDIGSPAMTRAIISRDIYGEQGDIVLIPKGSRAIGTYSPGQANGQTRVVIKWDRIITPTGIDIQVSSLGTDPLGRLGAPAYTDDHFWGQMASAVMVSLLMPYLVIKATNTGNQPVGTGSTTGSPQDVALAAAITAAGTLAPVAAAQQIIAAAGAAGNTAVVSAVQSVMNTPGITSATIVAVANAALTSANGSLASGNVWGQAMSQGITQFQNVATTAVNNRFPSTVTMIIDQGAKIAILVQQDMIFPAQAITSSNSQPLP